MSISQEREIKNNPGYALLIIERLKTKLEDSEAKHKEEIEQAREETRRQCADAMSKLFVSRMHLLDIKTEFFITRADIDKAIRNSEQDKGEGV